MTVSRATATVSLADIELDPSFVPYPGDEFSFSQFVSVDYSGFGKLTSVWDTWAAISVSLSFKESATGNILNSLVRTSETDTSLWFATPAQMSAGNLVACGKDLSGDFSEQGNFELLFDRSNPASITVEATVSGAAGVLDCDDPDPIIHIDPEFPPEQLIVPLPATLPLFLAGFTLLCSIGKRSIIKIHSDR